MTEREIQAAELARQDAEAERNRREELRRIGEGGPEQHIPGNVLPGRVEAEAERVAAEERRSSVRRFYLKLAATLALPLAFIALVPAIVGLVYVGSVAKENRLIATSTKNALCDFKTDLLVRMASTRRFVGEIKAGERAPIPGISLVDLERSLDNQQATIDSLRDLDCSDQAR